MMARTLALLLVPALAVGGLAWWLLRKPGLPDASVISSAYDAPLAAPDGGMAVFHLGHSLVGRDMPAMLAQLAPDGHLYNSQLGWGTSMREHFEPDLPINGFETENAHNRFRPAREAIGSGDYDAVVLTEMVELKDAIKYHDSAKYLSEWAGMARSANPDVRLYLYETWHHLSDPNGWLDRIDADLQALWLNGVLLPDLLNNEARSTPVRLIPAGQVMATFVRRVEAEGGIGNVRSREDLFARAEDGTLDTIHINDLGAYLVALTHFAVLYHQSPVGLPAVLNRADGTPATAPAPETARAMQEVVWQVVADNPMTGVRK